MLVKGWARFRTQLIWLKTCTFHPAWCFPKHASWGAMLTVWSILSALLVTEGSLEMVQPFFTEQLILNEQKNQGKTSKFFKPSLGFIFLFPFYFTLLGYILLFLVKLCRRVALIRNKWCHKSRLKSMRLGALRVRSSFVGLSVFSA